MSDSMVNSPSVRHLVSDEEWEARVALAACYRLVAHYGWDDLVETHISMAVPGSDNKHFLINAYGMLFEQITASSLVKIDLGGNPILQTTHGVNKAGFVIHSAIHAARPDAKCVMHTHTVAGIAVSMQRDGLLFASQNACLFDGNIGYHDVHHLRSGKDGMEGQDALVSDLGNNCALVMRNHGLLVCGETPAETIWIMHSLQKACAAQVAALAGGLALTPIPKDVSVGYGRILRDSRRGLSGGTAGWPWMLKLLDDKDPSFRE
jgi:ribulose-5-phosphate 4-epimerase/fuculose-1-phosphate aldolase